MIKIYSTEKCVWCHTLRNYLNSKSVQFMEADVLKDGKEMEELVKVSGKKEVPVVDFNGEIVIGFDKEKINELLKIQ